MRSDHAAIGHPVVEAAFQRQSVGDRDGLFADVATRPEIRTLLAAIAQDPDALDHAIRVATLASELAQLAGVCGDDLLDVMVGGLLHDIGKLLIPDAILKKPGPLTASERQEMRTHPGLSEQLLFVHGLSHAGRVAGAHHERWDGTGYPHGLRGEQIPIAARCVAVADFWDAVGSTRPYHQPKSAAWTIRYFRCDEGAHFEPRLVRLVLVRLAARWVAKMMPHSA